MKENYIKVLMVKPMEHPKVVTIPNNITTFNHLVSLDNYYTCDAEILLIESYIGILRNSEGSLLNLKGNRKVNDEIIAGTFFVVGFDEHGFISSLTDDNIQKFSERFWEIEEYNDKEVSNAYWDSFVMSIERAPRRILCKWKFLSSKI